MVTTILGQVKEYKKDALLTPLFAALEVLMEVLIPFTTALVIDEGIQAGNVKNVYFYGGIMAVLAMFSLLFGVLQESMRPVRPQVLHVT